MATTDPTSGTESTGTQSDKTNVSAEVGGSTAAQPKSSTSDDSKTPTQKGSVWVEDAGSDLSELSDEEKAARDLAAKDAAAFAKNPNKVNTREPVEGVGGQSFDVGVPEDKAESAAERQAREEAELRAENPNSIVYRKGTASDFQVG